MASDDDVKYTRGTAPTEKMQFPKAQVAARKVIVARNTTPSVERMLEDCAYTLSAQFAHFRALAISELFNDKQASAFNKMVASATALHTLQDKRVAQMRLASYSEDDLAKLEPEARKLLGLVKENGDQ